MEWLEEGMEEEEEAGVFLFDKNILRDTARG